MTSIILNSGDRYPRAVPLTPKLKLSHPRIENLKFATVGGSNDIIRDLVNGLSVSGGDRDGQSLTTSAVANFPADSRLDDIYPITVFMRVKIKTGASSNTHLLHYEGGGRDWRITLASGSSKDLIFFRDGSGGDVIVNTPNSIFTSDVYFDLIARWDGTTTGNQVFLSIDGNETQGTVAGSFPSDAGGNFRIGQNGSYSYDHIYVFNEFFSDAEAKSFSADPYQIIEPDIPIHLHIPVTTGNTISSSQSEEGDATLSDVDVLVQVSSSQTEGGDTTSASIVGAITSEISSSQSEEGDTTLSDVDVLVQASSSQGEQGDTTSSDLDVLVQVASNQNEGGDTTSASLIGVLTSEITSNQNEQGDTTSSDLDVLLELTSNQNEEGDTTLSNVDVLVKLTSNQNEDGDTTLASLTGTLTSSISSNQAEGGDTTSSNIISLIQVSSNQNEEGDLVSANLNNIVQLFPNQAESGDTTLATVNTSGTEIADEDDISLSSGLGSGDINGSSGLGIGDINLQDAI